ncbi:MAG: hypothetical protein HS127_19565 [Planctomycetia bacterium]|nr:hypothetical protein [Planctomycetia bacterium]
MRKKDITEFLNSCDSSNQVEMDEDKLIGKLKDWKLSLQFSKNYLAQNGTPNIDNILKVQADMDPILFPFEAGASQQSVPKPELGNERFFIELKCYKK